MDRVAFTTPDVGRIFLGCYSCMKVKPHYHVYAARASEGNPLCACGENKFRMIHIPEWRAAWWVVVVGWLWRKTILRKALWDPRMPVRA